MKIFICWSGKRSRKLAKIMQEWMPDIIPEIETAFRSDDIEKGIRWFEAVSDQLEKSDAGLICLTPEAIDSPWIHFEAGALAKAVGDRSHGKIYTYLYGVSPGELTGPLSAFQHTLSTREDTKRLVESIANEAGSNVTSREGWDKAYQEHWQELETQLDGIESLSVEELMPDFESLFQRKTFNEPFDECTTQNWITRYRGAVGTMNALQSRRVDFQRACKPYLAELYTELLAQLDGYAMDMSALLLDEINFEFGDEGKLEMPKGVLKACERRRERIKQLVLQMILPEGEPIFVEDSLRFTKLATLTEKKALLIHPYEWRIENEDEDLKRTLEENWDRCAGSAWEFDRIVFYLYQEKAEEPDLERLVNATHQELEKLESMKVEGSSASLHYAIRALARTLPKSPDRSKMLADVQGLLKEIEEYIDQPDRDDGGHIQRTIAPLHEYLEQLDAEAQTAQP